MPIAPSRHQPVRHFPVLDGLRGLAAGVVVVLHTQRHWGIELPHAFLAVDLFFVLSGFVLCHAYLDPLRNGALTLRQFTVLRVARLYPAFLLGLLVASVSIVGPLLLHHSRSLAVMANYVAAVLLGLVMLPLPVVDGTALFPLNPPMWSLVTELGSNLLLAAVVLALARGAARPEHAAQGAPAPAQQCGATGTAGVEPLAAPAPRVATSVHLAISVLAVLLVACGCAQGSMDIGSNWIAWSIAGGFARACYGMLLGGVLYSLRGTIQRHGLGAASLPLALALMLAMLLTPALPGSSSGLRNDLLLQLAAVLVLMPVVVTLALHRPVRALDPVMLALGKISYPLYAIHFPILHVCEALRLDERLHFAAAPGVVTIALSMPLAWWMATRYEAPVRDFLRRHLAA